MRNERGGASPPRFKFYDRSECENEGGKENSEDSCRYCRTTPFVDIFVLCFHQYVFPGVAEVHL
ncbi:MAG: hypothetical protein PWP09_1194 [Thermotogota bacterium]|nr:hypothetical protein [Thermotogota bacterium]